MAGGYIQCGDFLGDDKSGSAISGVLDALPECVPEEDRDEFVESILDPLRLSMEECDDHILIEPDVASRIADAVDRLYDRYGSELGNPEPMNAPQMDEERGLDATKAKWGDGIGWRYYCLHDLRQALRISIESQEPVAIHFD
jgi:hypothetical protein